MTSIYFNYIPDESMICKKCHGPSRFSCSSCETVFSCDEMVCRQQIYTNNEYGPFIQKILYIMGSRKIKTNGSYHPICCSSCNTLPFHYD